MSTPGLNEELVDLIRSPIPNDAADKDRLNERLRTSALSSEKLYQQLKGQSRVLELTHRRLVENSRRLIKANRKLREDNACMRRSLRRLKNATCATLSRGQQEHEIEKVNRMHLMMKKLNKSLCKSHCRS
jgi:phosphomevalonate kinase